VIVVLSPATVNSPWVAREVRTALQVQRERGDEYRVIPLLLPGVTEGALGMWFPDDEPVAVVVGADGLAAAMPELLVALGERAPTDREQFTSPLGGRWRSWSERDPTLADDPTSIRSRPPNCCSRSTPSLRRTPPPRPTEQA
jgi:hypothetical protein